MNLQTPPMGWNSWNTFGHNISDELVLGTARAMKEKGYLDAGYRYVARKFGEEYAHSLFSAMPRSLLGLREKERSSPDGE